RLPMPYHSHTLDLTTPVSLAYRRFFPFFLLRHRPPPASALFPYTTLFRSRLGVEPVTRDWPAAVTAWGRQLRSRGLRVVLGRELDRKSTRLNFSHLGISYAVFCLKKKKVAPHIPNYNPRLHSIYVSGIFLF